MLSTAATGRSLELFYIDGDADGLVTATLHGWIGHVLVTPRMRLAAGLARDEAGYAGVYLLLGEREGEALAYIGESEDLGARLRNHDLNKDWWTTAVLVASLANQLNKAHVRYLEARLIQEAKRVGRTPLANATAPQPTPLNEADRGKMEFFLANLAVVLPAVRVDLFTQRARPQGAPARPAAASSPINLESARFVLRSQRHDLDASAVLVDGEFQVQAGSHARPQWEGATTADGGYAQLHRELLSAGMIEVRDGLGVFTQAYAFKSPSAAAAVVLGRPANGAILWRTGEGVTYKDWEAAHVEQQLTGPAVSST